MKITLTQFIEILSRTALNKAKKVRAVKKQAEEPYFPAADCYKMLRDAIQNSSDRAEVTGSLLRLGQTIRDDSRLSRYPVLISGYLKWLGRKQIASQRILPRTYKHGNATLAVNPELRMTINGQDHLVKLYFKEPLLQRAEAQLVCSVIAHVYQEPLSYAVLDVQRGRLHVFDFATLDVGMPMVDAELDYIVRMWGETTVAAQKQGSESTFLEAACPAFRLSRRSRASVRLRRPGHFLFRSGLRLSTRSGTHSTAAGIPSRDVGAICQEAGVAPEKRRSS